MDLAQLISDLHARGNLMASWSGVETNVESVSNIIGSNESGKFNVELKLKAEPINEEELDRLAEEYVNERYRGYVPITEVFKAGYCKALNK